MISSAFAFFSSAAGEGEAAEAYGDMDEDEYPEDAPINMDADFMDEPATSSKKDKKKKKKSKKNKAAGEDEADDAPVASTSGGGAREAMVEVKECSRSKARDMPALMVSSAVQAWL